jgi:N6-L-threonylcarbamoyladenine synthase
MALVDGRQGLIWEKRFSLPVQKGGLGLRQSEAVFAHLKSLPGIWAEGAFFLKEASLAGVSASTRPRPQAGSYMPVFKVGEAFGKIIARTLDLAFLPSTHQEGHVMGGLWSAGLPEGRYLVWHLSGGTTELLEVLEGPPGTLSLKLIGGTEDLNAGQFIDRLGVKMGLPFPAGRELEKIARGGAPGAVKLPVAVKGTQISFSGPASAAQRLLEKGCPPEDLARAVETCIADSLFSAVNSLPSPERYDALLLVGGVAANSFIRERLAARLEGWTVKGADPRFAGDNAVGLAVQACRRLNPSAGG